MHQWERLYNRDENAATLLAARPCQKMLFISRQLTIYLAFSMRFLLLALFFSSL